MYEVFFGDLRKVRVPLANKPFRRWRIRRIRTRQRNDFTARPFDGQQASAVKTVAEKAFAKHIPARKAAVKTAPARNAPLTKPLAAKAGTKKAQAPVKRAACKNAGKMTVREKAS